jgi:hypothetical protein
MKYILLSFLLFTSVHSSFLYAHQKKNGGQIIDQRIAVILRQSLLYFEELEQLPKLKEQEFSQLVMANKKLTTPEGLKQVLHTLYNLKNNGSSRPCFDRDHEQQNICLLQKENAFLLEVNGEYYAILSDKEFLRDILTLVLRELPLFSTVEIHPDQALNLAERIMQHHQKRQKQQEKTGRLDNGNSFSPHTMIIALALNPSDLTEFRSLNLQTLTTRLSHPTRFNGDSFEAYASPLYFSLKDARHFDLSLGVIGTGETFFSDQENAQEKTKTHKGILPYCICLVNGLHFSLHQNEEDLSFNIYLLGFNSFYQHLDQNSFFSLNFNSSLGFTPGSVAVRGEFDALYLYQLPLSFINSLGVQGHVDYTFPLNMMQAEIKGLVGIGSESYLQLFAGPQLRQVFQGVVIRPEGTSFTSELPLLWNVGLQLRY